MSQPDRDISHHVTEELVPSPTPVEHAPPALDIATPARACLFATATGRDDRRKATSPIVGEQLKGPAANWYAARFPDLPAGTFPPWSELHAAMLHAHGQSFGAAGTFQDLHSLRRLAGSSGKEVYARMEEHSMLLRRKGVHNPGPEEQTAYILQNQLTAGESAR